MLCLLGQDITRWMIKERWSIRQNHCLKSNYLTYLIEQKENNMTVTVDTSGLSRKILKSQLAMRQAKQDTLDFARSITPIKTGYARANTDLVGDKIVSHYSYAEDIMLHGKSDQLPANTYIPRVKAFFAKAIERNLKNRGV
jgi:hypothetical protein